MVIISEQLQMLLFRVRYRTQQVLGDGQPTSRNSRIRLIIQIKEWFSDSVEREIRHGILMAFLGQPISSQNELNQKLTSILIEVTDANSRYLTQELCAELQDAIESLSYGDARLLPAAAPVGMAMPGLSEGNLSGTVV